MATNLVKDNGNILPVVVTDPATPTSGAVVRFGSIIGVALGAEGEGGAGATETVVDFTPGKIWNLLVDDNAGTGIAAGALLYYHDTETGSPSANLNNSSASADAFGAIALDAVSANATTTIRVMVRPTT